MKYFRLHDDIRMPGRWHLGDIVSNTADTLRFLGNQPLPSGLELRVPVTHPGIPMEFCLTSFAVPIAKRGLASAIASIAGRDIQLPAIKIDGASSNCEFNIPHCLTSIDCLDEKRSEFTKWTDADLEPDRTGQYRMVIELKIDQSKVPRESHFLRLRGWVVSLVVSEIVKEIMEKTGCKGAVFEEVS